MFMTSGSWGLWHDSVVPDDILQVPMRMPGAGSELYRSLSKVIDRLQRTTFSRHSLLEEASAEDRTGLLGELDQLVFELLYRIIHGPMCKLQQENRKFTFIILHVKFRQQVSL